MFTLRVGMAALALTFSAALAIAQTTTPPADTTAAEPKAMTPADTTATEPKAMPPADATATEPKAMTSTESEGQPPLPGANSFTESQARERMAEAGYMDVMELKKDDNGIWRGQAKKSGQDVGVALDYRGNIVQQ